MGHRVKSSICEKSRQSLECNTGFTNKDVDNPDYYDFTPWLVVGGEINSKLIADEIASWKDNKDRRKREADLFENAIYNLAR